MHKRLREDAVDAAERVRDTNWTGRHTVPATDLYPHRWSQNWAFVGIGKRHGEPERARAELVTLLDAQWSDGRAPQIVYDVGRDDDAPGAVAEAEADWPSEIGRTVEPGSPRSVQR